MAGLWAALQHPWFFLVAFILFAVLTAWLLPKLWRGVRRVFASIFGLFKSKQIVDDSVAGSSL